MDTSITELKRRCFEIIRRVERTGKPVTITRRGKAVARLDPVRADLADTGCKPWELVRLMGGQLLAAPGESVLSDEDFGARR